MMYRVRLPNFIYILGILCGLWYGSFVVKHIYIEWVFLWCLHYAVVEKKTCIRFSGTQREVARSRKSFKEFRKPSKIYNTRSYVKNVNFIIFNTMIMSVHCFTVFIDISLSQISALTSKVNQAKKDRYVGISMYKLIATWPLMFSLSIVSPSTPTCIQIWA